MPIVRPAFILATLVAAASGLAAAHAGGGGVGHHLSETTFITTCRTSAPCVVGTFPASGNVALGILPAYEGSVTLHAIMLGEDRPALSCAVPGPCTLYASGGLAAGAFALVGKAARGTIGNYGVWVAYDG